MMNKNILVNRKLICDECGKSLDDRYEPYLIDPDKHLFLHLCKECSDKRIDNIREMIGIKKLNEER